MSRKGFWARLGDLWRGFWGVKLSDAEARNAEAVYHNAINEHVQHHDRLKEAIARLVYLRNRLEADLLERRNDLRLVEKALTRTVQTHDDAQALSLIRKKRSFETEIARLTGQLEGVTKQADKAKEGLAELQLAVRRLKEERAEMLARKAHALARREAQEALKRLTDTSSLLGTVSALDNVRESILRLEHEVGLEEETPQLPGEVSMAELRRQAQDESDRETLAELKASMGLMVESPPETAHDVGGKTLGPVPERAAVVDAAPTA
jgi:phage shock protein A